jgi:hypothetical protein
MGRRKRKWSVVRFVKTGRFTAPKPPPAPPAPSGKTNQGNAISVSVSVQGSAQSVGAQGGVAQSSSTQGSGTTQTQTPVILKRGDNYKGCFSDNYTNKIGSAYTPSTCIADCKTKGYAYAGVKNGGDCYCSDTPLATNLTPATDCIMACTKDGTYYCGGANGTDLYSTNFTLPLSNSNNANFKGYYTTNNSSVLPQLITNTNINNIQDCINIAKTNRYSVAGIYQNNNCYGGNFDTYSAGGNVVPSSVETSANYQTNKYLTNDKTAFTGSVNSMGVFSTGYNNKQQTNKTNVNYVGCYTKTNNTNNLTALNGSNSSTTNINACKTMAQNNNYNYAMINNNKCYGTNYEFVKETKTDDNSCYMSCNDDDGYCGSNNNYSVFSAFNSTSSNYIGTFLDTTNKGFNLKVTVSNSIDCLTKTGSNYPYIGAKPTSNQYNCYGFIDLNNMTLTSSADPNRIEIYSKSVINNNSVLYCGKPNGNYIENKNRGINVPWTYNSIGIDSSQTSTDCGTICDSKSNCKSYYYDNNNKLCYTYNNQLNNNIIRNTGTVGNKKPTDTTKLSNNEIGNCYNIFYNQVDNNELDINKCIISEETDTTKVSFKPECIYNNYQLINKVNDVYTVKLSPLDNTYISDPIIDAYEAKYINYVTNVNISE